MTSATDRYHHGDLPNALTVAGIGIIVASGLYIIHRERSLARAGRVTTLPTP